MWLRSMVSAWSCRFSTCVVSFKPEVSEKKYDKNIFNTKYHFTPNFSLQLWNIIKSNTEAIFQKNVYNR